jgi:amidase
MTFEPYLSATSLLSALAQGKVSSVELLEGFLDRIDAVGGPVNAFVTIDAEGARAAARERDAQRSAGVRVGPLHGLPMTVKDTLETAGLRTTAGAPWWADHVPDRDAEVVARLRAAGAVIYAKSNLPVIAADGQSFNPVAGTTNNPWDLTRTPGGSSGGAAAALAAGLTPLEVGSDISGSIRIPAAFCGVYGHKPSYGIVPYRGHIMPPPGALADVDMSVIGPLARTVEDLELGLSVLAGPTAMEGVGWRLELPRPRARTLAGFRIAACLDDDACPVDTRTIAVLRCALDALSDAGAQIVERAMPVPLASSIELHRALLKSISNGGLTPEGFASLRAYIDAHPLDHDVFTTHARWLTMSKLEWNGFNERRARTRADWYAFFTRGSGGFDAYLCPSILTAALPHNQVGTMDERVIEVNGATVPYWDQVNWIAPASLAGLPATSVPAGLDTQGLPVGLQVIAPYLEDYTALELSRQIGAVLGGFQVPPGY